MVALSMQLSCLQLLCAFRRVWGAAISDSDALNGAEAGVVNQALSQPPPLALRLKDSIFVEIEVL